jgi:folate-dependent tRNA-U54 methylase TrmFO/GidA
MAKTNTEARQPEDRHDRLLGLTKPGFALVLAVVATAGWCLTTFVLAWALWQNQSNVAHLARVTDRQSAALRADRHLLSELCNTNSLTSDAIDNTVTLLKDQIRSNTLPPAIVAADRAALDKYESIQLDLASRSACPEVTP